MDERLIRIQAVLIERTRQVSAALEDACNLRAEIAIRDARLAEAQKTIEALQKKVDDATSKDAAVPLPHGAHVAGLSNGHDIDAAPELNN